MADVAGGSVFSSAAVQVPAHDDETSAADPTGQLAFSRAYSIALSPQLIYTRSALLPTLVSSKVYRQLEFLAVGSWWIFEPTHGASSQDLGLDGHLKRIPGSREDIFGDKSIDLKVKRSLMKFLKVAADPEAQSELLLEFGDMPFDEFLVSQFAIPERLQAALHALTLSAGPPNQTKTSYAVPRIFRHLASIGVFGPGFGSVIPKWGGLAEVAQVACRAGAVGGGVYVLGQGIESYEQPDSEQAPPPSQQLKIQLRNKEVVYTTWLAGAFDDLPRADSNHRRGHEARVFRYITVISSSLQGLFPEIADGAPPPAGTVVVFPPVSLDPSQEAPVYIMLHSSETGECPAGQSEWHSDVLRLDMMIKLLTYIACNFIDDI